MNMQVSKIKSKLYHAKSKLKKKMLCRDGKINIGDHTYGTPCVHFGDLEKTKLVIGKYCSISQDVHIFLGGNHRTDWVTTYPLTVFDNSTDLKRICNISHGDVIIGNDVWIGFRVIILSGTHIGDGAVIGAGSVVTKDIPPYAIVAGNPARIVRYRFTSEQIEKLLNIKWWEWDIEKVKINYEYLLDNNISQFIDKNQ